MDSQLIADQKVEALNRITQAVHQALPYWEIMYESMDGFDKADWDKDKFILFKLLTKDGEVLPEMENLLRIIIEEKTLLDQK